MDKQKTASIDLAQLDRTERLAKMFRDITAFHPGHFHQLMSFANSALEVCDFARRSLTSGAPAEPVAWMRSNKKECTTNESKVRMQNAGFGHWLAIAKEYDIPLYAAPVHDAAAPSGDQTLREFAGHVYTAMRCFDGTWGAGSQEERRVALESKARQFMAGAAAKTEQALMDKDEAEALLVGDAPGEKGWPTFDELSPEVHAAIGLSATAAGAGSAHPEALDERAGFEAWAELTEHQKRGAEHEVVGWYYFDDVTNDRWEAWQARAALTQQAGAAAPSREDAVLLPKTWKDAPYKMDHVAEAWARGWNECLAQQGAALARAPLPAHPGQDERALPPFSISRYSDTQQRGVLIVFDRRLTDCELQTVRAALAHPSQDGEKDAQRLDQAAAYRLWRDCEISEDGWFMQHLADYLPAEALQRRPPTADEWDAAMAKVMRDRAAAQQDAKGGA